MSHVTAGKALMDPEQMNTGDLDRIAIEAAIASLSDKLEFVYGQKTYRWVGQWYNDYHAEDAAYKQGVKVKDYGKCEHVIRFRDDPDAAEIGLVRLPNGMLAPVFDTYASRGHELEEIVGGYGAPRLTHQFAVAKVIAAAKLNAKHTVKRVEKLADGRTRILIGVRQAEKL